MTLEEAAKKIGKSRSFFSTMKRNHRAKFNYIKEVGEGDLAAGYMRYSVEYDELVTEVADMLDEAKERKLLYKIGKELLKRKVVKHIVSVYPMADDFRNNQTRSFRRFTKLKQIKDITEQMLVGAQ
jgi:hypothetical protein